jgi:hypothetical protein
MRRRDLAWALLAGATVAPAQTAPPPPDELAAAKQRVKANGAALAKFSIPMATEPAFAFKA